MPEQYLALPTLLTSVFEAFARYGRLLRALYARSHMANKEKIQRAFPVPVPPASATNMICHYRLFVFKVRSTRV